MKKFNYSIKNISNLLFIICLILILQLGCDWKKFAPRAGQTNSNVESRKENSESPKIAGNCVNQYYPVGANVERKYHITYTNNSVPAQDYTEKYTDFKDDNFIAKTDFKDVSTTINWRCTADGLLATQYSNSIDMKNGVSAKIETLKSEGVSFPSDSHWKQGEKWMTKYEVTQSIKNPNGGEVGESKGNITQNMEIVGTEDVTTPAGTFQTFKVKATTLLDLTITVKGVSVPTKVSIETTAWFAKDVGMVKSQSGMGAKDTATIELLSFKK